MIYQELSNEWRIAFELSVKAFKHGALPIGCVVTDCEGKVISQERAHMVYGSKHSNVTQHAEMGALSKIALPDLEQRLTLYTTIEPCPMCFGAINCARVAELHFGTYDPWGGSTNLAGGNWYMRRKPIDIQPADVHFQQVMALFLVYAMMKTPKGFGSLDNEFVDRWGQIVPNIKPKIGGLIDSGFSKFRRAEEIFSALALRGVGNE